MSKSTAPISPHLRARGVLPTEGRVGDVLPHDTLFGLDRAFMRTRSDAPRSGRASPRGREGAPSTEAARPGGTVHAFLRARGLEAPEALVAACVEAIEARAPLVLEAPGDAAVVAAIAAWAGLTAQIDDEVAETPEATDAWWVTRAHASRFSRKKVPLAEATAARLGLVGPGPFSVALRFNDARFQGSIAVKSGAFVLHLGAALAREMAEILDADDLLAIDVDASSAPEAPVLTIDPYVGELRTVARFVPARAR